MIDSEFLVRFPQSIRGAFIRHAERYPLQPGKKGDNVMLTPKGMQDAYDFGEELKNIPLRIYSSPVFRCMLTAEQIAKGHGGGVRIHRSSLLGNPGAYITNQHEAGAFFAQTEAVDNYKAYIQDVDLPGHRNCEKAFGMLEKFFDKTLNNRELTLYISHDIFIMYYMFSKKGIVFENGLWLDFMDGILLE